MTDRELLELAAKAAGVDFDGHTFIKRDRYSSNIWDPLHDDGDALRLAVKLGLSVYGHCDGCRVNGDDGVFVDATDCSGNPLAATRRAIVVMAAEIGRQIAD